MDIDDRLDAHLARAIDELLSVASLAVAHGRPEIALGASAALDRISAFPGNGPDGPAASLFPEVSGDPPHAQH